VFAIFPLYNVGQLPHLFKLTVSMYSGSMLAQLKESGILQRFRSLSCQPYRLVLLWELTEGEALNLDVDHSTEQAQALVDVLRQSPAGSAAGQRHGRGAGGGSEANSFRGRRCRLGQQGSPVRSPPQLYLTLCNSKAGSLPQTQVVGQVDPPGVPRHHHRDG
jgi:hypothetical protein